MRATLEHALWWNHIRALRPSAIMTVCWKHCFLSQLLAFEFVFFLAKLDFVLMRFLPKSSIFKILSFEFLATSFWKSSLVVFYCRCLKLFVFFMVIVVIVIHGLCQRWHNMTCKRFVRTYRDDRLISCGRKTKRLFN